LKSWTERSAVRGADPDPAAVLRASFLRALRVLRVKLPHIEPDHAVL